MRRRVTEKGRERERCTCSDHLQIDAAVASISRFVTLIAFSARFIAPGHVSLTLVMFGHEREKGGGEVDNADVGEGEERAGLQGAGMILRRVMRRNARNCRKMRSSCRRP